MSAGVPGEAGGGAPATGGAPAGAGRPGAGPAADLTLGFTAAAPKTPSGETAAPGGTEKTGTPAGPAAPRQRIAARLRDPVTLAIAATTLVALGLRAYHLSRPGFLFGVSEYDDGPYFGSAVRLTQGILPYRDFVLVQPPGITLLMLPAAMLAKVAGTAWGLAVGRILTVLAGAAGVVLMGLLVRHRGAFATLVACGALAVFPDSVAAAHTVLVEPWLVLFCLAGAVAVLDRDGLAAGRRLAWGGVAFGFAGAIEGWAIVPVFVLLVLCLADPGLADPGLADPARGRPGLRRPRVRRAAAFAGGVAAGFCVPVLPFAIAAPRGFYQSLVIAQIGPRTGALRVPLADRLYEMTGLSDFRLPARINLPGAQFYLGLNTLVWIAATIIVVLAMGVPVALNFVTREPPATLDWFALVTTELVVVMFLWPSQFHYHFAAFLAPFLGLAIALPTAKLAGLGRPPGRQPPGRRAPSRWAACAAGVTVAVLVVFTVIEVDTESRVSPVVGPSAIAAAKRVIPPGACVVSDNVNLLLLADRFVSDVPGCGVIDDGLGTDLALSHGLTPATGAGEVPAVARIWRQAFGHAQFVWFSDHSWRRIAWSPSLLTYFRRDFKPVMTDQFGDTLYQRRSG
jgi:alpha-1,2-mannosyltransferase